MTSDDVSAITERLRKALDVIGDEPGMILVRGEDRWEALPPGQIGQVLGIGEDLMPGWYWIEDLEAMM